MYREIRQDRLIDWSHMSSAFFVYKLNGRFYVIVVKYVNISNKTEVDDGRLALLAGENSFFLKILTILQTSYA